MGKKTDQIQIYLTRTTDMDIRTIIRAAIPDATDEACEWILWERTPYPMGAIDARSVYKAASRMQRAANHKLRLCELCDRVAEPGKWICHRCEDFLTKARQIVEGR